MKRVTLHRSGNTVLVEPTSAPIYDLLAPALTYTKREWVHGYEAKKRRDSGLLPFVDTDIECFAVDFRGRIATFSGFIERIIDTLEKTGRYKVVIQHHPLDRLMPPHEDAYKPRWDLLYERESLRYRQDEFLYKVAAHGNGRYSCPPGWGKSRSIRMICTLFPKARILVTTDSVPIIMTTILPDLYMTLPDVGVITGKKKQLGQRIMCVSFDSLHHVDPEWPDIIVIDEVHQAGSNSANERLGRFENPWIIGLTATDDMRADGANLAVEGLCGPLRLEIPYQEAQAHGLVGEIRIVWGRVPMTENPCEDCETKYDRLRAGIWTNQVRNQLIIDAAMQHYKDESVLVTCMTVEHVVHLKALCPEAKILCASELVSATGRDGVNDWKRYQNLGLIPRNEPCMTDAIRNKRTDALQRGVKGIYLATPILNTGFNATRLRILCRADASRSRIIDTQIPGRVSRKNDIKSGGIVYDWLDEFDRGFAAGATQRSKDYQVHGWIQDYPTSPKSKPGKKEQVTSPSWEDLES